MRLEGQKVTYFGMPFGMWALFAPSFRKQLTAVLGYDEMCIRDRRKAGADDHLREWL